VPVLLKRFPNATPEQLLQAHAYAYGGAIIQDMGYYPFGNAFFSDLTHYVRSGDFVLALIEESRDLDEYAFALGALAHYAADASGHPIATNRAVAMMYPKLARKYGPVVTYEDQPSAHAKVEFGFDVDQVAEGNYAPKAYHDFIGFEVRACFGKSVRKNILSRDGERFCWCGSGYRQLSPRCFHRYSAYHKSSMASQEVRDPKR
jgi:Zinc dependent phospholipase C